ncbi:MAG TPA: CsbD family protein, partial [Candidatus Limnocylindria bacterium]
MPAAIDARERATQPPSVSRPGTRCAAAPRILRSGAAPSIGRWSASAARRLARRLLCIGARPALAGTTTGGTFMDSDRIEGPIKEAGGKVKEEWGDLTDDSKTEAEGHAQQVEGDLQNEW